MGKADEWAADNYLEHFGLNALNRDNMALAFASHRQQSTAALEAQVKTMREALEKITEQDFWSAVDERDEVDGRCAEIARQALSPQGDATKGDTQHD